MYDPRPGREIAQRFGENLVRSRRREGLSQEELGFEAGLHRTEIGMLERGVRIPRIDTLIKLVCTLGVPTDELLDGITWLPGPPRGGGFSVGGER